MVEKPLDGRVALITGAAGAGIGRATARILARDGASIAVTDVHQRRLDETVAELREEGSIRVAGYILDCGSRADIDIVLPKVTAELGLIDILVNNAALNPMSRVTEMSPDVWDEAVAADLSGPWYLIRAVLTGMITLRRGSIVNVTSIAAYISPADEGPYAAAKAGLHSLTRTVAREYGHHGIRCNSVAPGLIWTRFMEKYEARFRADVERTPLRRFGRPDEVAEAIAFLAGDASSFITGETVNISGGLYFAP
jgi:3-oxoacyl-[acyl-carrier protein] reductase